MKAGDLTMRSLRLPCCVTESGQCVSLWGRLPIPQFPGPMVPSRS